VVRSIDLSERHGFSQWGGVSNEEETYQAINDSAPSGTSRRRVPKVRGPMPELCAPPSPPAWLVNRAYKSNRAGTVTDVKVNCLAVRECPRRPAFNSSSAGEPADEWVVCAKAQQASS
jgi:hypothetical protein